MYITMGKPQWFVVVLILLVGFVISFLLKQATSETMNIITASTIEVPTTQSHHHHSDTRLPKNTTNITETKGRIWNITLIVELRGELGNHLALLANARITQIIAQTKFPNLHIHIIGQHQSHPKWLHAYNDITKCFPQLLQDVPFHGGIQENDPQQKQEFLHIQQLQQRLWNTSQRQQYFTNPREEGLEYLQQILSLSPIPPYLTTTGTVSTNQTLRYSLPYLITNDFTWEEGLKHSLYYENIRQWFQFNTSSKDCCCENILHDDHIIDTAATTTTSASIPKKEVVYHHRNFMTEMKERARGTDFTEANPETIAYFMFGNTTRYHPNHTKITITSRYKKGLEPYIDILQNTMRIETNVLYNRTGVQDFCYLMMTPHELVGKYHSTFVRWAAFLGKAPINRFYGLNQNIFHLNSHHHDDANYTSPDHPIHLLEYIEQNHRSFISEQFWQPAQ